MKSCLFFAVCAFMPVVRCLGADVVVPLWEHGAPGFESRRDEPEIAQDYWVRNIHNPSLTVFLPPAEKATGTGVIVVPGGGHRLLVFDAEGRDAAKFLNQLGVAAFVLKHRLAREEGSPYTIEQHARQDAYRAMRTVRHRAVEWGVDPQRVGMMGFSAGGEVVALVAYPPGEGDEKATDLVERENGRPNFQIVIYPGPLGVPAKIPTDAPPAFFLVANDDRGHVEPVMRQLQLYREAGASVEAHILAQGGHGFNMGNRSALAAVQHLPDRVADWLQDGGWLKPAK